MVLLKKALLFTLLWSIFLSHFGAFGQVITDSYEKLWDVIQNDTVSKEKKLLYLDIYYQKAQTENNALEAYRALEKKSFLVSFNDAVLLLNKMKPLVTKINNDSLSGLFLNTNTVLYYNNRYFTQALDYATQSEVFNEKSNKLYNLNFVRITIGNINFHTRNYTKAENYFLQAKNYYQYHKDYNHKRALVLTLYNLSKTYWQLKDIDKLNITIKESDRAVALLTPKHQQFETAYTNYVKGGLAYLQNNWTTAQSYFENALPIIKENQDFSNEHVIYLYLGKIAWQQNQKQKALTYFTKIDTLFKEKKFLNYELRETYDYLISYYKETNQPQLQLQATESLIALNHQFEKEQQHLTNTLHYELETKKLEASKTHLTQQLNTSKNTLVIWLVLGGLLVLLLVGYGIWQNRQKKEWRSQYNWLIDEVEQLEMYEPKPTEAVIADTLLENKVNEPKIIETVIDDTAPEQTLTGELENTKQTAKLSVTELRLLQNLELFETEKGFLNPLKLDDLAAQLNTNRSTLSKLINIHKNVNFNQYINSLRVKQVLIDLKYNKQLRKLSMQGLAETYGFANAKTFTAQFKTETHLTPAYFIEQLEFDDLQKAKHV